MEMTNYIAKCCFHSAERHQDQDTAFDLGHCHEIRCECTELSDKAATVLEVMNHEFGTEFDFRADSYLSLAEIQEVSAKWPHTAALGVYGRCLSINYTASNECHGYDDPMTTANYQTLQENWSDQEALCDSGFTNCYSIGLQWNSPAPADMIETIRALENYPVLDEELMSKLEIEWAQRDWESFGLFDARRDLQHMLHDAELPESEFFDNLLQELVFRDEQQPPYHETGGGTVFSTKEIEANMAMIGYTIFCLV